MYAPIFQPELPAKSPEVLAVEAEIIAEEGPLTVNGSYYAKESQAAFWRNVEAEKRVRRAARAAAAKTLCSYCLEAIDPDDSTTVVLGGAELHSVCAADAYAESKSYPTDLDFAEGAA